MPPPPPPPFRQDLQPQAQVAEAQQPHHQQQQQPQHQHQQASQPLPLSHQQQQQHDHQMPQESRPPQQQPEHRWQLEYEQRWQHHTLPQQHPQPPPQPQQHTLPDAGYTPMQVWDNIFCSWSCRDCCKRLKQVCTSRCSNCLATHCQMHSAINLLTNCQPGMADELRPQTLMCSATCPCSWTQPRHWRPRSPRRLPQWETRPTPASWT
jgi:hypothetical protein